MTDTEEILEALLDYPDEEVVQFVIKLDENISDWDFTQALYMYFKEEITKRPIHHVNDCLDKNIS